MNFSLGKEAGTSRVGKSLDVISSFTASDMVSDRETRRQIRVQLPVNGTGGSCLCMEYFNTEIPCCTSSFAS